MGIKKQENLPIGDHGLRKNLVMKLALLGTTSVIQVSYKYTLAYSGHACYFSAQTLCPLDYIFHRPCSTLSCSWSSQTHSLELPKICKDWRFPLPVMMQCCKSALCVLHSVCCLDLLESSLYPSTKWCQHVCPGVWPVYAHLKIVLKLEYRLYLLIDTRLCFCVVVPCNISIYVLLPVSCV